MYTNTLKYTNKLKQSFVYNIKLCIMRDIFLIPAKKN